MQPHVIAERPHPGLALADAHERLAERRGDHPPQHEQDEEEADERQIVEGDPAREGPRQAQVRARHAGDAVIALGERDPAMGQAPDHHPQGQRDHQEIHAGRAQGDQPEDPGDCRRQHDADRQGDPERGAVSRGEDADAVGADPEIGGVAERREADVAQDEVEAHRQHRVDHGLGEQRQQERGDHGRRDQQHEERAGDRDPRRAGR